MAEQEDRTVKVGSKIEVNGAQLWTLDIGSQTRERVDAKVLLAGKVVLRFMPGAFSPTCSNSDLPAFADDMRVLLAQDGSLKFALITGDNPHALRAWVARANLGKDMGQGIFTDICDQSLLLTRHLGLNIDLREKGMGICSNRAAVFAVEGIVQAVSVEESPGKVEVCAGNTWRDQVLGAIARVNAGQHVQSGRGDR